MLRNMVTSLFANERISTTDAKAKEARRLAERLITRARKGYTAHQEGLSLKESGKEEEARQMEAVALSHWRQASRYVRKPSVLKKLFDEIAPHFLEREGGYTRIIKVSRRLGDNAKTVLLELVDTEKTERPKVKKKDKEAKTEEKSDSKEKASEKKAKTKAKAKSKTKTKSKAKARDEDPDKKAKPKKAKAKKKAKTSDKKKKSEE
jgi:large subunit ribosomal protein L17